MSDRYNALTVVLERDIRDDDAEPIINAIKQIKGVLTVEGNVSDYDSLVAEERARRELGQKIIELIYPKNKLFPGLWNQLQAHKLINKLERVNYAI